MTEKSPKFDDVFEAWLSRQSPECVAALDMTATRHAFRAGYRLAKRPLRPPVKDYLLRAGRLKIRVKAPDQETAKAKAAKVLDLRYARNGLSPPRQGWHLSVEQDQVDRSSGS